MPFCPFCRVEYRQRLDRCPECDVPLVDKLPPRPEAAPVAEMPVARFRSQLEAEMWAEILHQEGIPTVLVPLGPGAGGWGTSLWDPYEVRVRADDLARARALLPDAKA
jgi:hypothetical protein